MDPDPAASHETQSSNLASTNAAIEDDDAKDVNIRTDVCISCKSDAIRGFRPDSSECRESTRVHRISASLRVSSWNTSTRFSVRSEQHRGTPHHSDRCGSFSSVDRQKLVVLVQSRQSAMMTTVSCPLCCRIHGEVLGSEFRGQANLEWTLLSSRR